jgi:hypothetical protein
MYVCHSALACKMLTAQHILRPTRHASVVALLSDRQDICWTAVPWCTPPSDLRWESVLWSLWASDAVRGYQGIVNDGDFNGHA